MGLTPPENRVVKMSKTPRDSGSIQGLGMEVSYGSIPVPRPPTTVRCVERVTMPRASLRVSAGNPVGDLR